MVSIQECKNKDFIRKQILKLLGYIGPILALFTQMVWNMHAWCGDPRACYNICHKCALSFCECIYDGFAQCVWYSKCIVVLVEWLHSTHFNSIVINLWEANATSRIKLVHLNSYALMNDIIGCRMRDTLWSLPWFFWWFGVFFGPLALSMQPFHSLSASHSLYCIF